MTNRALYRTVAAVTALIFAPLPSSGSPADLRPATFHACGPAPQLVAVIGSVAPGDAGRHVSSLRRLSSLAVSIAGSAGRYDVQSGSAAPVAIVTSVDRRACQAVDPKADVLMNGGTMPGNDAAALAAVLAYRRSNTWPYGAAHIDDPRTQIDVQTRNGRVIVAIVDYKTLFTPNLDCSDEEFYRVDTQTFEVRPFDGCGAGTAANRLLPTLRELPD